MELVELDSVCEIIAGQSPPSSSYNQDKVGVPFFQGKADFGRINPTVRYWCTEPKKMSVINDILFSVRAPVGSTNVNNIEASIGRGLAAIRCNKEIDLQFLLHYLRANEERIANMGTGSTFKAITIKTLKSIKIPLPPLPTQKRIASILDEADTLRQLNKQLITKYDALTQSLFLEMFVKEKKFEQVELIELVNKITDGTHHTPTYTDSGIPFLRVTDITKSNDSKKFISKEEHEVLIKRCNPEKEDILYTKNGTIGVAKIVDWDYEFSVFVSLCLIKPKHEKINNKFLETFLNTPYALNQAKKHSKTGTITNLHLIEIKKMKIPLPPITLQNQFAERVALIEQQKAQAQQSLQKSEDLFNSLLQKAFKGELVK
ncbi:restriction endonuclease subunit S [Cellulophaga baltica]|uniref:restriction endonuclease subunit S n=1 Tax=Cellulophaga baltica TaxID=76594 RepID=UPI000421AE1A|nr:restriction endonuclease subunit S [Cellulophaga baltica]